MFRNHIQGLVERLREDGGMAGVLMGFDGVLVATYQRPGIGPELQEMAVELAHVLAQVGRTSLGGRGGALRELALRTERFALALEVVNEGYFLAVALRPTASLGKARHALRVTVPVIRAEM
jgi:hypothetical protein